MMADQTAVTYYGAPQIITVRYLLTPVPGDDYPGKLYFCRCSAMGLLLLYKLPNVLASHLITYSNISSYNNMHNDPITELQIDFNIFNKTSTRLPESMSVMFTPLPQYGYSWMLSKLGQQIDPKSVVLNSSQYQHGKNLLVANHVQHLCIGLLQLFKSKEQDAPNQ